MQFPGLYCECLHTVVWYWDSLRFKCLILTDGSASAVAAKVVKGVLCPTCKLHVIHEGLSCPEPRKKQDQGELRWLKALYCLTCFSSAWGYLMPISNLQDTVSGITLMELQWDFTRICWYYIQTKFETRYHSKIQPAFVWTGPNTTFKSPKN